MNVYENIVNCIEVENMGSTLKHYEESGCAVKAVDGEGCSTLSCGNEGLRVCQRSDSDIPITAA